MYIRLQYINGSFFKAEIIEHGNISRIQNFLNPNSFFYFFETKKHIDLNNPLEYFKFFENNNDI